MPKNSSTQSQREEVLNAELARLITQASPEIDCFAENRVSDGHVDILATIENERIAIEAKKLSSTNERIVREKLREAAKQASDRVKKHDAEFGVAVAYPTGVQPEQLNKSDGLIWAHIKPKDEGEPEITGQRKGTVAELADWLRWVPAEKDPGKMTSLLNSTLKLAAGSLQGPDCIRLLKRFNLPKDPALPGTIRVLLTVAAAVMFHSRLQAHLEDLPDEDIPEDDPDKVPVKWHPPSTPSKCLSSDSPISDLNEAWDLILRVDYRPIFEAARVALQELEGQRSATNPIKQVGNAALRVASEVPHLRHDLMGSIFHEVLDTARYDGSFYTTTAAATLLAGLSINEDDRNWADPDEAAKFCICDPACGSGTLLMAAAERVYQLRHKALGDDVGQLDSDVNKLFAKEMLENSLWGYDINRTAIHLAATTLALLSPAIDFTRMGLYDSKFGESEDKAVHLGSVDLLRQDKEGILQLNLSPGSQRQVELDYGEMSEEDQLRAQNPPKMDLVIMNPPFTRGDLRHDQFEKDEEKNIKAAEKKLVKDWKGRQNKPGDKVLFSKENTVPLYSSSGLFVILAEHLASPRGGG